MMMHVFLVFLRVPQVWNMVKSLIYKAFLTFFYIMFLVPKYIHTYAVLLLVNSVNLLAGFARKCFSPSSYIFDFFGTYDNEAPNMLILKDFLCSKFQEQCSAILEHGLQNP